MIHNITTLNVSNHLSKRLSVIDLYLAFTGRVCRADLMRHFDVSIATASRTLKEYRTLYPSNIEYSVSDRSYVISADFSTDYLQNVDRVLELLAYGRDIIQTEANAYGSLPPTRFLADLQQDVVAPITRALVAKKPISVKYSSGSGTRFRDILPLALFQGGGAWYFRALDMDKEVFRTYRFSRAAEAKATKLVYCIDISSLKDSEWENEVLITLGPHPKAQNQDALRGDLGLTDKPVRNIQVREALAGFVLTDLRVDCSIEASLDPHEYYLRLLNRHELEQFDSMHISPGFSKQEQKDRPAP